MTFEEIEKYAHSSIPLPDEANTFEHSCYQALSFLYLRYRQNGISRDDAKLEKLKLKRCFERDNQVMYPMYEKGRKREDAVSHLSLLVETEGCPLCKKMMRIMDGREDV